MHRVVRSLVLAAALLAVTATATFAHECYVVNRGSTGSQQSGTNSNAWLYVTLPDLAMFLSDPSSPDALPPLNAEQLEDFVAAAEAAGVPSEFSIFLGGRPHTGGFTIADNDGFEKNGHAADGSGMEHFFDAWMDEVIAAYMGALGAGAS
ncbi:MAG TPA: hypothetical protein VHQ42_06920 [Candidatus Limnocylindria bacterium]|nr:hypothetical protein [Candidatus Limnocylindria bacterium]